MTQTAHQIHATCLAIQGKGVLLLGESGAGKSQTALRLLDYADTEFVADDRVDLRREEDGRLQAVCPPSIRGLLEVRDVGVIRLSSLPSAFVYLTAHLFFSCPCSFVSRERLPASQTQIFLDVPIPRLSLSSLDPSTPSKIRAALLHPIVTDLV